MKMINFKCSKPEVRLIAEIVRRAVAMASKHDFQYKTMEAHMDITACHCNGMPLDLPRLLNADDFNFAHDVFGIRKHINRITGEIDNCFVPRCAFSEHDMRRADGVFTTATLAH